MDKAIIFICCLLLFVDCSFGQNKSAPPKKYAANSSLKSGQPSQAALKRYIGIYQLTTDKNRTITITKENDYLMGEISGQTILPLLFKSATKFEFEGVTDASCEFISYKGILINITVFQNGKYTWKKIK